MFPLGHTYDKVKKTIDKAKILNKLVRTNTVIGTFNIDQLDYIVNDLI
jgi:MoaA/NifB/PqqE/SkfB family radical SAM enzyme